MFKCENFLTTYNPRQNWSWPTYFIHYITKNPSTAKVYQKLIESCKYFFIKNPILIIEELYYRSKPYKPYIKIAALQKEFQHIYFNNIKTKIWISQLKNYQSNVPLNFDQYIDLYRIDAEAIYFKNEIIFNKKFAFVFANAKYICLIGAVIKDENGIVISLEKLVEAFPKAKRIYFQNNEFISNITPNTVQNLSKIPHFFKLDKFELCNIPETFDIVTFFIQIIMKNKHTKFFLHFGGSFSHIFLNCLDAIINEIISTEHHNYRPPIIDYYFINKEKSNKMKSLYYK